MSRFFALALCVVLASSLLAACASPPAGAPPPSAKAILFDVEAGFTGAAVTAAAYVSLPSCDGPAAPKVCKDSAIAAKVALGIDSAKAALSTAETLVLGCSAVQYVAATATPPAASCGQPVADQTAQNQAITAAQAAIDALQAALPILQKVEN